MSWEIKDNEGVVKAKVNALEYNDEWMGRTSVTVTVESPEPIDFAIGNYLVYRGERFEINYDPGKIKSAPRYAKGDAFKYENIKFNSLSDELTRCDFLDVVLDDNQIHYTGLPKFTFFGTVQDFANRIKANLDRAYPGMWTVVVSPDYTETKELNISVDNQKVWNMLETIVNDFKVYFTTKGRTITIGASGVPADHIFTYGKGNGLYEIEQNAEADQAIVTRLRAYGSDRNIPRRYYQTHFSTDWCVTTIHAVTERDGSYHFLGKKRCKLIFTLPDQYVDKTKCVKDSGGTYWFAVKIHGKTYAAAFDGTSNSYQIGTPPPVTVEGVSNITLRKSEMEAIEAGTEISFTAFVESAPGIIRGQHIPDNMAINNLMLPGFPEVTYDPYIDSPNIDALGIREGTIFFDGSNDMEEIFPSIEGMTAEQLKEAGLPCDATGDLDVLAGADQMTDTGEGEVEVDGNGTSTKITPSTFRVTVKDLGFDINDYVIPGNTEKPTVSFKDGKLGGRDFEIVECSKVAAGYELELNRVYDEDIKLWFPYKDYNAKAGDKFVLLHIGMPDVYIKAASQRLLKAAQEWLAKNDYSRSVYAPKVDEIFMARQHGAAMASGGKVKSLHDTLCAGMMMLFEDSDLNIDASIFIDRLTIKEEYGSIPTYEVTLKEEKSVGRLDKMQNQIDSLASGVGSAGYSAAQIRAMISAYGDTQFLSKLHSDRTAYRLAAGLGFQAGDYKAGESGAMVDGSGNAELLSAVVRQLLRSPRFASGLSGEGWKLWMEDGLASLELDRLTVRQIMTVFELIIDKIRAVGGQICVSAANGKIKTVTASQSQYYITFEQENSFVAGDLMRCQTFTNGHLKSYWAEVSAADGSGVWINTSEFVGQSLPEPGDECVLMGNTTDKKRQNLILISATEDGQPRMDVLDGVHDKNFADALRARLGNLDGISDSWFPLDNQPHGNGLYSDNAYLRGTFLLVTGEDIMTKFEIVEGKIQSMIEAVRDDLVGDGGYLANSDFKSGLSKWHYKASPSKLYQAGSSDKWLWLNGNTFANKGEVTSIVREGGRTVVRLRNSYIQQANADMRSHPTFTADENGVKHAVPVYLSFFYRCKTAGKLSVKFDGVGKTGFADFDSLEVYQNIAVTDDYVMFACEGLWNGTGDFIITFTGDICINLLTLSTDRAQALTYKYRTLFEQSEKLVRIAAQNFDQDGNVLAESGIFTTAMASGLYAIGPDGNIKSLVQAGQTGVKIKAENLDLEGHLITANGNFKILEDGSIETKNGTFTGRISSESGEIGGFTINANSIISEGKYTTSDSSGVDMATSQFFLYSGGRGFMGFSDKYKTISLGLEPFPPGAIIGSCLVRCENETPSGTYKNYGVFINVSGGYENIGLFMRGDIRANASGYHVLNGNVVFDGNDEIRIAINMDEDGEYTKYYTGVTFAPEDYNLDRVRFRVCNGLIVGVSEEK